MLYLRSCETANLITALIRIPAASDQHANPIGLFGLQREKHWFIFFKEILQEQVVFH